MSTISKVVNSSKLKTYLPTSQQIPAPENLVSQQESLFWGMIYVHMARTLSVEIRISRVKCISWLLEVSMSLIVLLVWKLLGCLDQQRIPDVWCFHWKYYFNRRMLTHLMGGLPTGPSCLPTLPHLLKFFCEIKSLDTWILPKTKQN